MKVEASFPRALKILTALEEETRTLGSLLGKGLRAGDVLCLYGAMGAGKTVLVQGIARGLAGRKAIEARSPSFVLIARYPSVPPLYHIDLYRLEGEREIAELGLEEYFYGDGVTVVEWAEKLGRERPERRLDITFTITRERARLIEIEGHPELSEPICQALGEL
ncbi:MAG: tRNA (adenosine(37)-N6)-threonylcarbamoyltransferase complex ATPase subunit type 1 TsaE [Nitrospinota bacterium]